jgi:UDP-3-O-[3-hydroxymyristoyl] glucosamine N-acyltransferase LpxD
MYNLKEKSISVKEISNFLNINYTGKNFKISSISSLNNIKNNSILFYSDVVNTKFQIKDNVEYNLKKLEKFHNVILISFKSVKNQIKTPVLVSKNPRLDFQRVLMEFFVEEEIKPGIHKTAVIDDGAKIGKNVFVGSNCYIATNVTIGENTKILSNTCIFSNTTIGKNSVIKSNTTIGSEGFSFSYTGDELFHFPHLGSILIGNNVWIGSNCTIEKSQMDQTIIEDHVKIDDLVQIGHNSIIKKFSQIAAGTVISGRAKVGKGCWIAPHVVIDNGNEIGDNCLVGTSSLVKTNFPKNSVIIGSPAKLLRKNV